MGISKSPKTRNPGRIIYINNPRLVFPLLKIDDIMNSRMINARLIPAIIAPINVSQFLEERGSFMVAGFND